MTAPTPLPSRPVPPMPPPHPRLHRHTNGRGLHWPRRTIRLRLTLMYGAVFLLCGTALLAVTYFLTEHYAIPGPVVLKTHQIEGSANPGPSSPSTGSGGTGGVTLPSPGSGSQVCAGLVTGSAAGAPSPINCSYLSRVLTQQRSDELDQLLEGCGVALGIMAMASIGLGWLMAGRVLRPLRTITAAARHISASNLNQRLPLAAPDDELRELGETFNGLLARLEGSFGAQRQFVANASHELRTPLARQRTLVEVALADPQRSAESLQAACERVLAAGDQQERLIEAMLTLARSQRGLDHREPLDLQGTVTEVLRTHEPEARRRELGLSMVLNPAAASGEPELVERLVVNLVDNALRHNVPGGWVEVLTGVHAGRSVLSVVNSGPRLEQSEVGRLFEPFRRLGPERAGRREGHGLGLSIVVAIAAAHNAELTARALPEGGLAVDLWFPPPTGEPDAALGPPRVLATTG
ncbi:MAG TPA: ATP-binding protein [Streptosporangiaceae bacterium]|nr:ATP-binding protein [Streptosporangiaceae bacterium]